MDAKYPPIESFGRDRLSKNPMELIGFCLARRVESGPFTFTNVLEDEGGIS